MNAVTLLLLPLSCRYHRAETAANLMTETQRKGPLYKTFMPLDIQQRQTERQVGPVPSQAASQQP